MSALNSYKRHADKLLKILTEISIARGCSAADAQLEARKTIGKITRGADDKRAEILRDWRYSQSISRPLDARPLVRLKRGRDGDFNPVEKRAIGLLKGDRPKPRKNEIERLAIRRAAEIKGSEWYSAPQPKPGRPTGSKAKPEGRPDLTSVSLTIRDFVDIAAPAIEDHAGAPISTNTSLPHRALLTAQLMLIPDAELSSVLRELTAFRRRRGRATP